MRILCDAIPFCFGPATALETLLHHLSASSEPALDVDVLATGSVRELLERSGLPFPLLPVDSEDPAALAELDLKPYSAFVTICNPVSLKVMQSRGLPSAYVDFLLWMHSGPPGEHFGADLYLAENYPGTTEWIRHRGREIPALKLIPPLIQPLSRAPRPGTLLVGFGGMYSRLTIPGVNTGYASYAARELLAALPPGRRFDRVILAGPRGLRPLLAPVLQGFSGVSYQSFSHPEFLQALGECEAFLSHPGLYAPFEAMLGGVPTGFLPPSNYTQILQLRHFRSCGMADHSFSWDDAGTPFIPADLPEPEGVTAVLSEIAAAERSPETSAALRQALAAFLSLDAENLAVLGARQKTAAGRFSGKGPQVAAQYIASWCQSLARPIPA
jgi:hypothetical protein